MAIAYDTSVNKQGWIDTNTTNPITWSHTCSGDNRILFVSVKSYQAEPSGVTYNSVSLTKLAQIVNGSDYTTIYYLIAPATGSNTVSVAFSSRSQYTAGISSSYTGVLQSTPPTYNTAQTASNVTGSVSITPTASNSWVIALMRWVNGSAISSRSGYTARQEQYTNGLSFGDSNGGVADGSSSYSITVATSTGHDNIVVAIVPQPLPQTLGEYLGAGSGTTKLLLHLNGSSADSSGNGNNGTDTNITYSLANGRFGQGAGFNGSSSFILSANNVGISGSSSRTMAFIAKTTDPTDLEVWLQFGGVGAGTMFGFGTYLNNWYFFGEAADYNTNIAADTNIHFWVITYNGTAVKVYQDGKLLGSSNVTLNTTDGKLYLGRYIANASRFMTGTLDEVIIETGEWSAEKVKKYYTMAKGRFGII